MPKFKDLFGQRFGRLFIDDHSVKVNGVTMWPCICDCGNRKLVSTKNLCRKINATRSCGCIAKQMASSMRGEKSPTYKHGNAVNGKRTRLNAIYSGMMQRCYNKKNKSFKHYGGRGIKVCERWKRSFVLFALDMGNPPKGMSLDRIENDKDYCPENCKWSTQKEQTRNTRANVMVKWHGKEMCLSELAEFLGINYFSLHSRYCRQGMTLKESVKRGLSIKR